MQRIRIKFTKGPEAKFTSHLDVIRCFERTIRRTDLPIAYSSGFNPRMRIAWGPPLQLGFESVCEMADIEIDGWIKPADLKDKINSALPKGFKVLEAVLADPKGTSLASSMNMAEYVVSIEAADIEEIRGRINGILGLEKIEIDKDGKLVNKRPLLHKLEATEDPQMIAITVEVGSRGTLKPRDVLDMIDGIKVKAIKRAALFVS